MTQIEAITKVHAALTDFPNLAGLFPPDTDPGEWGVCYGESIWVTWEPKKEVYKVQIFNRTDTITFGYYPFNELLTVLKFATL